MSRQRQAEFTFEDQDYALNYGNHWTVQNLTQEMLTTQALTGNYVSFQAGSQMKLYPLIALDSEGYLIADTTRMMVGYIDEDDQPVIFETDKLSNIGLRIFS